MQKKDVPVVSVVIATYNSRRTIEKCLRSIKEQSYPNIDIVVVDALKYDPIEQKKCKAIIKKYARYYQDGPERSIQRNRGIKEAKGDYILIIDQDMYLSEDVVSECYETLTHSDYVALLIPEKSIGNGFWTDVVAFERYISTYLETGLNECVRFFHRNDANGVGCYDPDIVGAEDSDFHYKMAAIGKIGKIKAIIEHDEGTTTYFGRVKKKYYYSKAFRKYVQRYPEIASKQFFPIKPAYIKHLPELIRHPFLTAGMIALRTGEVIAGGLGILFNR